MAWRYCPKCGAGVEAPNLREQLEDLINCPQCEQGMDSLVTRDEALSNILDYAEALEERIKKLEGEK